jgi:hypothetical protein
MWADQFKTKNQMRANQLQVDGRAEQMNANSRPSAINSPAVSRPQSSAGTVDSTRNSRERERESPRLDPSLRTANGDSKLESESKSRAKTFIILKPQSMHPTFTRIQGGGISDQEQSEREVLRSKHESCTHVQDPPRVSSAVGTEIGLTTSENQDPFAGIAADVTDASGRRVLMTPQQLESRLGAEHGLGRSAALGAVPPLSFATLAAFAPTPAFAADASPSAGGGDQDSSWEQEQEEQEEQHLVRDLRQVRRHARAPARRLFHPRSNANRASSNITDRPNGRRPPSRLS